jgi:hypothetical protein
MRTSRSAGLLQVGRSAVSRMPRRVAVACAVAIVTTLTGCADEQSDISFFVLVKSSNYSQDVNGELALLNYHFFSEIFLQPGGSLLEASLTRAEVGSEPMRYELQGDNYYMEGGHFDSVEEADAAYPNGEYSFDIRTPSVEISGVRLRLAGPTGETDIPAPIEVSFWQGDERSDPTAIDPFQALTVRWSPYSNGTADPRGIVDDMIFLVVADCQGERIFHTGLPFQGEYTTYRTTEVEIGTGVLQPGQPYSAFVEFPHVVDSQIEAGIPGFTSYATATYLDFFTSGPRADEACPDAPPPMDTGQTDRMDRVEPGRSSNGG